MAWFPLVLGFGSLNVCSGTSDTSTPESQIASSTGVNRWSRPKGLPLVARCRRLLADRLHLGGRGSNAADLRTLAKASEDVADE